MDNNNKKKCPSCSKSFSCGIDDSKNCWCMGVKIKDRSKLKDKTSCLCNECLEKLPDSETSKK